MTAFLSWLWAQASNVRAWFSSSFSSYLHTVRSTWGWIVSKANDAYDRAVSWAWGQIYAVKLLITDARNWAGREIAAARSYASGLFAPVWGWIISYYNYAVNYVNGQIAAIKVWVNNTLTPALNNLRAWTSQQITNRLNDILNRYAWLTAIKDRLGILASTWTDNLLANTIDLVITQRANIKMFFQDPAGFILSLLWPRIIEYGSYAIAYALGTVTETLPPLPPWGRAGGPFTPPDYPSPGPTPSGLIRPLSRLYVSGYTYGPNHRGTDFGLIDAQPVFAAHPGTIGEAGWSTVGYGFTVTINGSPWWTRYGHLKQVLVQPGQQVSGGDVIAYGNSTGNSTGSHLHFEIKRNGVFIDPLSVFGVGG